MLNSTKLADLLALIPKEMRQQKKRAMALITVGENGEVDFSLVGMSERQFKTEVLPIVNEDELQTKDN